MPTYEYKCKACGERLEVFQSMKDAPRRKCPACGKSALERLIGTGAAVIFKGSGFYQTDYRTESYKKGAEADKPTATNGDAKDGKTPATAEAKPVAEKPKTESKPAVDKPAKEKKPKTKA
jgi:putative FmdB family regulatory protein